MVLKAWNISQTWLPDVQLSQELINFLQSWPKSHLIVSTVHATFSFHKKKGFIFSFAVLIWVEYELSQMQAK